jgi:Uma2 family endonuclease
MDYEKQAKHGVEKDRVRETPVTYDDYAAMPDDGQRYEIDDGALQALSPAPSPRHQEVGLEIYTILKASCGSDYYVFASPIDVIFSPTEVRQPDLVMVHRSRANIITRRAIEGPPDLCAEVLSTHSLARDKFRKLKTYAKHGVPEYWIVDPVYGSLDQYVLSGSAYELINVYSGDEPVHSDRLTCINFTMNTIMRWAKDLPD